MTSLFLSQDPYTTVLPKTYITDPEQQNSYSYARNNPVIYNDPTGESIQTYAYGIRDQFMANAPMYIAGAAAGAALVAAGVAGSPVILVAGAALTVCGAGSLAYNIYTTNRDYNAGLISKDDRDYNYGRATVSGAEVVAGSGMMGKIVGRKAVVYETTQMWTKGRFKTPDENASKHFKDHGDDLNASTKEEYIQSATDFIQNPPKGTLRITRQESRQIVQLNIFSRWFSVAEANGTPKTTFISTKYGNSLMGHVRYFLEEGLLKK